MSADTSHDTARRHAQGWSSVFTPRRVIALTTLPALVVAAVVVAGAQDAQDPPSMQHAEALSRAFRHAAEVATPSVVTVKSVSNGSRDSRRGEGRSPFDGTPFEDFFDDEDLMPPGNERPRSGVGSGVIIDSQGIILTNNHVVEGADEIVIELADGTELDATDVKTDPRTDLAVVHVEPDGSLPAARLGDSDELAIGDWVIAIGNPFELEQTVSAGIISGKGRSLGLVERGTFLQTDAAINPGNSGGPLVTLRGEVIGINTAIASRSGGYNGIGFAIPVNTARRVAQQLIEHGRVRRAYLGVQIGEVDAALARQLELPSREGVVVVEVYPNTPADDAGIERLDVIVEFAGKPVRTPGELQQRVEQVPLDSRQEVTILRGGEQMEVEVVAQALPDDFGRFASRRSEEGRRPDKGETGRSGELGITVGELDDEIAEQLEYPRGEGVLVTAVDQDSVAFREGLRAGQVILKVGRQDVNSPSDFEDALAEQQIEEGVLLLVRTPRGNSFIVVKP